MVSLTCDPVSIS